MKMKLTVCMLVIFLLTAVLPFTASARSVPLKQNTPTVYLTFDDGPGKYTGKVLDILKSNQVRATFFVLGQQAERSPELIRRIVAEGHALGNHTYNHNYKELYGDFKTFWKQVKQTEDIIYEAAGYRPQLLRAPGGTYGHFDNAYFDLLQQAGYNVVDWNVDSGDSKHADVPAAQIEAGAVQAIAHPGDKIVLLHDGGARGETVKALPGIIKKYRAAGYSFGILGPDQTNWKSPVKKMASSRPTPDASWIAKYILPNKTAFFPDRKPLVLEIGNTESILAVGEYELDRGEIIVPLRTAVERLGGKVTWDSDTRTASAAWNGRTMRVYADTGKMTSCSNANQCVSGSLNIAFRAGTIQIPLRDLLEWADRPFNQQYFTHAEYRVTAVQEPLLPSLTSRIVVAYNESNN